MSCINDSCSFSEDIVNMHTALATPFHGSCFLMIVESATLFHESCCLTILSEIHEQSKWPTMQLRILPQVRSAALDA
jgi:hypothetical protein